MNKKVVVVIGSAKMDGALVEYYQNIELVCDAPCATTGKMNLNPLNVFL